MKRLQRLANLKVKPRQPGELVFYADEESRTMRAEVVEEAIWKLKCIRDALNTIPEEYRADIIESIHDGEVPAEAEASAAEAMDGCPVGAIEQA